jgi:hypothetical protein
LLHRKYCFCCECIVNVFPFIHSLYIIFCRYFVDLANRAFIAYLRQMPGGYQRNAKVNILVLTVDSHIFDIVCKTNKRVIRIERRLVGEE